ncbi:ubiquitin-protein ligase E3 [Schizosaccharomyces cryophilus OY26]|uniref:RING-type E3 ubiquitin transferase n=1 Tax=Schizosaccharomyces cryophilus (strain OY26 / ATCC MYA-4695 / CBS 11777 / NBRC 106824 / NRRL Y48691) TaxID=653667 RepID=S9X6P9_SCHCR|nr:ubiquitin-protein ligase E3 [Schizosaccharomyces cryophilus OY26]EPY49441.1 ubiquitin-protein ligase E3 [Schizosaccharomyces cryophilus OY26]
MDRRRWRPSAPVVILLLLFIFFAPVRRIPSRNGDSTEKSLQAERNWYSKIQNSTFLDAPEIVRQSTTFPKEVLSKRNAIYKSSAGPGDSHSNHTSVVIGNWKKVSFDSFGKVSPNVTWHRTLQNIVNSEKGGFSANVYEYPAQNSNDFTFVMNMENSNGTSLYQLVFYGDRIDKAHALLGATEVSPEFPGVDGIPWLFHEPADKSDLPFDGQEYFEVLKNKSLGRIDDRIDQISRGGWSPLLYGEESVSCRAYFYGFNKNTGLSRKTLAAIEDEYYHPQGVSIKKMPDVLLSGLIYSPDCNVAFTFSNYKGPRNFVFDAGLVRFASFYIIIIFYQIFLLLRQMRLNSPSYVQRLSFITIAIQACLDAFIAIFFLSINVVIERGYLPFVSVAFLSLIPSVMFTMRYLALILRVQNSNSPPPPPLPPTPNNNESTIEGEGEHGNANTTNVENVQPEAGMTQHERDQRDWSAVCLRFYFVILVVCIVSLYSAFWPVTYRFYFISILLFTCYSFWVPQIIQNVKQGTSRSFSWIYIIGLSISRMYMPTFIFIYSETTLKFPPKYTFAVALGLWMCLQVFILFAQDTLGPRFFLPKRLFPSSSTYDYHPIIQAGDLEALMHDANVCPICMQTIELVSSGSTLNPASRIVRRNYMLTPCHHLYHRQCLLQWMETRSICPVCRCHLPPV